MRPRRALALLVVCACGQGARHAAPDASTGDGGDAGDEPDLTPPSVVATHPETDVWLKEPVRFVFDEPIDITGATVTATLDDEVIPASLALADDRTIAVTLDAIGTGHVEVTVDGTVSDLAGNLAAMPLRAHLDADAWNRPAIDRGEAHETPALVIGDAVYAAWTVDFPARVVVSKHDGVWHSLGGKLGAGDARSVAISLDAQGRLYVAWIEGGTARVSRWDGDEWKTLPSPGTGTRVALSGSSVAVFGGTVAIRSLAANNTWDVVRDHAVGGTVTAVAFAGDAVGWIERTGNQTQLRVFDGPTQMASIGGANQFSLAARGSQLAIAWDEFGGSWNVVAALANGTSWTRLGRPLDIDAAGDARAPAVSIDTSNRVLVAWTELVEGVERGAVARWSGAAWSIVGDLEWHASATQATQPVLAVRDTFPVVASAADNAVHVARYNGRAGGVERASIAGCNFNAANPAATLSATGCFANGIPHAGLVPYDIVNELWTDGTKKRRWIGLRDGTAMTASSNGAWNAPAGTIVLKEFAIETTPGNPATRRPVETRILASTASGWQGFSYRWRTNGSDADLLSDGQYTFDWPLDGGGTYRHVYPSRSQCLSCHHASYGPLLGVRPQQLARWFDYGGKIQDQAATLAALGVGPAASATPFVSTHDRGVSWEQRTRAYMAANCAHCHNPNHIAIKDLRFTTPLAQTRLCEVIVPGAPQSSVVYARVTQRPGMPPLGTLVADPLIEQTLGNWISGMTSCP